MKTTGAVESGGVGPGLAVHLRADRLEVGSWPLDFEMRRQQSDDVPRLHGGRIRFRLRLPGHRPSGEQRPNRHRLRFQGKNESGVFERKLIFSFLCADPVGHLLLQSVRANPLLLRRHAVGGHEDRLAPADLHRHHGRRVDERSRQHLPRTGESHVG